MGKYRTLPIEIDGGAMHMSRKFAKASDTLNKANPMSYAMKNKKALNAMTDIGKFTQNKILPGVVSTTIPLASTALGGLATMYGGPMAGQMVSGMSQNLMEQYIPDKYQSNNKYIGLLGDAMSQAFDPDPMAMAQLGQRAMGQVQGDMNKLMTPKQKPYQGGIPIPPAPPRYIPRPNINYNPDNPYQDLMMQTMKMNQSINQQHNDEDTGGIYAGDEVDETADHVKMTKSPYQQKEGNLSGLMGGGFKKKRGRKKRTEEVYEKIEIYKRPPHKRFSHAKNSALDQLFEANELKAKKKAQKMQNKMVKGQIRKLKTQGYYDPLIEWSDSDDE